MIGVAHVLIAAALAIICAVGLAVMRSQERRQQPPRAPGPRHAPPVVSLAQLTELRPPPTPGAERLN